MTRDAQEMHTRDGHKRCTFAWQEMHWQLVHAHPVSPFLSNPCHSSTLSKESFTYLVRRTATPQLAFVSKYYYVQIVLCHLTQQANSCILKWLNRWMPLRVPQLLWRGLITQWECKWCITQWECKWCITEWECKGCITQWECKGCIQCKVS